MKKIIKHIIILIAALNLFSCSDEFVNEKLNISGVAVSPILISPEWDAGDYEIVCEGTGNSAFVIESKPDWLELESNTGTFTNSTGTIRCKAFEKSNFSEPGIYIDQMIISANGKFAIPVYYISEGDPVIEVPQEIEVSYYSNGDGQLKITNKGDGILIWNIFSLPDWLNFMSDYFDPSSVILSKGSTASLLFEYDPEKALQSNLEGIIVISSNDKNHHFSSINVKAQFGTPQLNIYYLSAPFVFNTNSNTQALTIGNNGTGILVWNLDDLPDWLSASKPGGTITTYSSENIDLTCDFDKLQPGLNTATIIIKTNDPEHPTYPIIIKARKPGTGESIRMIEGNIIDVAFNTATNTLYYATSQPNKLVAYNISTRTTKHEVVLTKAPTSLGITEDFTKAAIGHGGLITTIDLNNFSVIKTYDFNFTILDVEWVKDDMFCFTESNSTISNLYWMNTSSGEIVETTSTDHQLGSAILKKVPNQPYLLGARTMVFPSGIFVYDIETKTRKSYSHSSIDRVWFFDDGNLFIDTYSNIIKTSTITSATGNSIESPSAIGVIKTGEYSNPAWWVDHSAANHSFWAIFSYYGFTYYPPVPATIYQFEDNDYSLVNTYYYDNFYQPDDQHPAYEVEARYVFCNNEGTELSVLRKGKDNNNWSVEFIAVQ